MVNQIYIKIPTILFLLFFVGKSIAQPEICPEPAKMTSFCKDACIICDINGYKGRHDSNISGSLPSDFCTTIVHNAQWIAFIAGTTNITIEMTVTNCVDGDGLEMTVYESRDCENFVKVFNCDGDVFENTKQVFKNTKPLTIGQYYYLTMDGNGGDNCDWTLKVLEGSTKVLPLDNSGIMHLPNMFCPNVEVELSVDPPVGGTEFDWTINNVALNINSSRINHTFPSPGIYDVCVTSSNVCNAAPPVCQQIEVVAIPPKLLADTVCQNSCLTLPDTVLCTSGIHQLNYTLPNGCDSIVIIDLQIKPQGKSDVKLNMCEGDSIFVNNNPYFDTDEYQIFIPGSILNCDSIVNLSLKIIECNIDGLTMVTDTKCNKSGDGKIEFSISNGTPPFTYEIKTLVGQIISTGVVSALNSPVMAINLKPDDYVINIFDNFNNTEVLIAKVEAPDALSAQLTTSDYNGTQLSCANSNDGSAYAQVQGGTPPYEIIWSNGIKGDTITQLGFGTITASITDAKGCPLSQSVNLIAPAPLSFGIDTIHPGCGGKNTGGIIVNSILGGTSPYQTMLDAEFVSNQNQYLNLNDGIHVIEIIDLNGCKETTSIELVAAEIPEVNIIADSEMELGDSILAIATTNDVTIAAQRWESLYKVSCDTCLSTFITPYKTTFIIFEAVSNDGCIDRDSIEVRVVNNKNVLFPNIFNPTGIENIFRIYGGKGVSAINFLRVYDRWGSMVYQEGPHTTYNHLGWDGTFNGNICETGVYVWQAEVRFLDDIIQLYQGDVTLIK